MGIDAIAALKISFQKAKAAFAAGPSAGRPHLVGADGVTFAVEAIDDGILVHTFHRFGGDPDELAAIVRGRLGPLLDEHDDPRGVLIFPDVAALKSHTYAELVDEIGEAGEWIPKVSEGYVPERLRGADLGALESLVAQITAGVGADAIAELHRALSAGDTGAFEKAQTEFVERLGALGNLDELTAKLQSALDAPHEAVTVRPEELAAREEARAPASEKSDKKPTS